MRAYYGAPSDSEEEDEHKEQAGEHKIHLMKESFGDPESEGKEQESSLDRTVREANMKAGSDSDKGAEAESEDEELKSFVKSQEDERAERRRVQERPLTMGEKEQLDTIRVFELEKLELEGKSVECEWNSQMCKKEQVTFCLSVSPSWSTEMPHGHTLTPEPPTSPWEELGYQEDYFHAETT